MLLLVRFKQAVSSQAAAAGTDGSAETRHAAQRSSEFSVSWGHSHLNLLLSTCDLNTLVFLRCLYLLTWLRSCLMECCRVRMWVNRGLCRVSLRFPMISLWVHSSFWASLVCRRSRAPSTCWRSPEDTEDKHRTDSSGNICTSNSELHEMLNR